jgi:hypothetical protein
MEKLSERQRQGNGCCSRLLDVTRVRSELSRELARRQGQEDKRDDTEAGGSAGCSDIPLVGSVVTSPLEFAGGSSAHRAGVVTPPFYGKDSRLNGQRLSVGLAL